MIYFTITGFTGEFCESELDLCVEAIADGECSVNATCLDYGDGYLCYCPLGLTGFDCTKGNDIY